MTQTFSQDEPTFVSDPIHISSDTVLSLPETLPLPSTPSVTGQISSINFPPNCSTHLNDRYSQLQGTSTPLRLDWNSFVELPTPFA